MEPGAEPPSDLHLVIVRVVAAQLGTHHRHARIVQVERLPEPLRCRTRLRGSHGVIVAVP
jgi:hypothetical protein